MCFIILYILYYVLYNKFIIMYANAILVNAKYWDTKD